MLGAIAGDIIGSPYEMHNINTVDFPLFTKRSRVTDDTVLTIAISEALLNEGSYKDIIRFYANKYPRAGYGGRFREWMKTNNDEFTTSYGSGSAMRVSPVGWWHFNIKETLEEAERSAKATHNHEEGIRGAKAIAACVYFARMNKTKAYIEKWITQNLEYDLTESMESILSKHHFSTCQATVPPAIRAFLEGDDWENSVRLAVSYGGDTDTIASMTGAISEAYYSGVPDRIIECVWDRVDNYLKKKIIKFIKSTQQSLYNIP